MVVISWLTRLARHQLAVIVAVVCVGALVLLAGECSEHLLTQRIKTAPRPATQTNRVASWGRVEVGGGSSRIVALRPSEKERRKLERNFGVKLSAESPSRKLSDIGSDASKESPGKVTQREVLAVRELPPMPTGGRALITLPPGGGEVEVTIKANRAKFLELTGIYGIGALAGLDQDGQRWRGYAFYEPLRLGRLHTRVEAGAEGRSGDSGLYAMAGVEIRSR